VTTQSRARCDYCAADVPAGETYAPLPGVCRCRDVKACERRQIRAFDPTLPPDEDVPRPVAEIAPPGAACEICATPDPPGGLYERIPRSGAWFCRNTAGCQQRAVDPQYLHAWSDTSPDLLITPAAMRHMAAAARPEIAPEPAPPDPAALAAEAWRVAMGRRRERT
jgi:hypothetical protein